MIVHIIVTNVEHLNRVGRLQYMAYNVFMYEKL